MLKRYLPLLFGLVIVFVSAGVARASSIVPTTTNCSTSGQCNADQGWGNGTQFNVHGGATQVQISSPPVSGTGRDWFEELELSSASDLGAAEFGVIKLGPNTASQFCSNTTGSSVLDYFWIVFDSNGHRIGGTPQCWQVDSLDVNKYLSIQIGYFTSGGGGVFALTHNVASDTPCERGCFVGGADQTYGLIDLFDVVNDYVNGHYQWGVDWLQNKYQGLNGVWSYQQHKCSSGGTACLSAHLPPAMYWHVPPENDSIGGELYSCIYDSNQNNNCTLGG